MNTIPVLKEIGLYIMPNDYKGLYNFMIISRASEETILRYGYEILKQVVNQDTLESYIKHLSEKSKNPRGASSVMSRILDACVSNYIMFNYENLLLVTMRTGFKQCFDFLIIEGIDHRATYQQVVKIATDKDVKINAKDFLESFLAQKIELTRREKAGEDVVLPLTKELKRIAFIRAASVYGMNQDDLRRMIERNEHSQFLERAILEDRTDIAEDLIVSSACVNERTAPLYLIRTIENNRDQIMKMLMKAGVRPTAQREDGTYCLTIAVIRRNLTMISQMIQGSARALKIQTDSDDFLQAVDKAYELDYLDVFKKLCDAGFKAEMIVYDTGDSLLAKAVKDKRYKVVEILLSTGSELQQGVLEYADTTMHEIIERFHS
jgi:hypothetical protein